MIDELDKEIISLIQGDIPLVSTPFSSLAERIGISEEKFIDRVNKLIENGIIRRFGATLRHQEAGFSSNAMVAWYVPDDMIEDIGTKLSKRREVSHCYHRRPQKDWRYNLFTMIHADGRDRCYDIAKQMSESVGINDYALLFSEKEFKKTSMKYF